MTLCVVTALPFLMGCGSTSRCANKEGPPSSDGSYVVPGDFIKQIASTDCIIVSNRLVEQQFQNENLSVKLSGKQVELVMKAISSLKAYPDQIGSASLWDLQLQFFHHKDLLGTANFEGAAIVIDLEYCDHTGVLDKIYDEESDKLLPSVYKSPTRQTDGTK